MSVKFFCSIIFSLLTSQVYYMHLIIHILKNTFFNKINTIWGHEYKQYIDKNLELTSIFTK